MGLGIAILISMLFLSGTLLGATWHMAGRLAPESNRPRLRRWLIGWAAKGLLVPLLTWVLMNVGLSLSLQPFMPQIQAAQNAGADWIGDYLRWVAVGLFIISSYWSATTLGWTLVSTGLGATEDGRKDFKALCLTCGLGLSVPAALVLLIGGWPFLGMAAFIILGPIAGYSPALLAPPKSPPMYARAVARIKFGKYAEAESEIIRELEKSEDDFEGWLMLAELYATRFHDLAEAEKTVLEICDQPSITAPQLSIAMHRLADWHLKLAQDPDAARRALGVVCSRFRGTHLARMAQHRINQLPETAEDLREQQAGKPVPLPALGDQLDQAQEERAPTDPRDAASAANACTERLKQNPDNTAVREKLARLLAEHLQQADLAIEQVLLLLNMPDQPDAKRAEWLALAASWHLKYRHDPAMGRRYLERVVREFPQSAQAFAARHRLERMNQAARNPGKP